MSEQSTPDREPATTPAMKTEPQSPQAVAEQGVAVAPKPSDQSAIEKPAAAEKPAAPTEPPFTVDVLSSCTSRYTRKAWNLFLEYRTDLNLIRTAPIRATIEAKTPADAEALHRVLVEAGVKEISRKDKIIALTTTFEVIQTIIKLPTVQQFDAVKA